METLMNMKKNAVLLLLGMCVLIATGCSGKNKKDESEAERIYYVAFRDLEEDLKTLPDAIKQYSELSIKYAHTPAGKKAVVRLEELNRAQKELTGSDTLSGNAWIPIYIRADSVAPGYPPVVKRLGTYYYNNTYLASRTGAMTQNSAIVESVLQMWNTQDEMWARYEFRETPDDRHWRDQLCKQATQVARMLEAVRRYGEALDIVNKGLDYAIGEDVIAHARVFASFYNFRRAKYAQGIELAQKAIEYEFLEQNDRARAHHVIGLCYSTVYSRSKDIADLDEAIDALNEALRVEPSMIKAKDLLKTLRKYRQGLPS
jgi:tetratricopeptide (TPR) repeat protein